MNWVIQMASNLPPGCSVSDLPGSQPQPDPEEPERCRHCGTELPDERHQELGQCPQQRAEELSDQSWEHHRERQLRDLGIDPEDPDV